MAYLTENYMADRLTPLHNLKLPLSKIGMDEMLTVPSIADGRVYFVQPAKHVRCVSEENFVEQNRSSGLNPIKGINYSPFGLMTDLVGGASCLVDSDTLEEKVELASGVEFDKTNAWTPSGLLVNRYESEKLLLSLLNSRNGAVQWDFSPREVMSGYAVISDRVVILDSVGGVYCINLDTGDILWEHDVQSIGVLTDTELKTDYLGMLSVSDNPHVIGNTITFGYLYDYLIGIDLSNGKLKWKHKVDTNTSYTTVTAEGVLYYFSPRTNVDDPVIHVINSESGEYANRMVLSLGLELNEKISKCVYTDVTTTHFWCFCGDGFLAAINLETGTLDWSTDLEKRASHNPILISNNRLYIATADELVVMEGDGGYLPD